MQNAVDLDSETIWRPTDCIDAGGSSCKHAIVVLNRPIRISKTVLLPLWEKAQVTLTVDGGTDQWMEYLEELADKVYKGESPIHTPTLVTGDMDSISLESKEKLERVGSKVISTIDQRFTDYTKALMELAQHCESQKIKLDRIFVIVDTSGRLDHLMGNLNTLYKTPELFHNTQVIQIANDSLTWLLTPGKHKIIIPEVLVRAKSWCGILPLSGRADRIITSGLMWNLDNITMEFGGFISTSNTYEDECTEVKLQLPNQVIWTMGIEPLLSQTHVSSA